MFQNRKIVVVIGKTGYGKSYVVKHEIIPYLDRLVVFDVMSEYNLSNCVIVETTDSLREVLLQVMEKPKFSIVCRFDSIDDYELGFEMCYITGNVTVVIEEINQFCSPYAVIPRLEQLIRFGRHKSVSIVGITQRLNDVGALMINNADLLVCFQLTDRNDIERLRSLSYIENKADAVARLDRYEYLSFVNT